MNAHGVREHDDDDPSIRDWQEFRGAGLLWLVNKVVFHPRGYALAFATDGDVDAPVVGWVLLGDGSEPWTFDPSVPNDEMFAAVKALMP